MTAFVGEVQTAMASDFLYFCSFLKKTDLNINTGKEDVSF